MNELVTLTGSNRIVINRIEIETKEYKGQRVITAWDISDIHKKDVAQINRQFKRNRKRFVENSDFFEIMKDEFLKCQFGTLKKISNNQDNNIQLYTESGYLKIVRTFRDNFSWGIYDMLIKSYFIVKTGQIQPRQLTKIEVLQMALKTELENEKLRNENQAKDEIIKGINGELELYQLADIINRILRAGGGNYGLRYNEVYRVFREQKHIDLKIRMNNCNKTVKAKNRFKSVLEYALANGYGKDLLKIVIRLYPESVKIVRDGIKKNTGLGNNEVLLLN